MIKRHQTTIALLAICIAAGSGCATDTRLANRPDVQLTAPRHAAVELAKTQPLADATREPLKHTDQLDLSQALQLALRMNPGLIAKAHHIHAAEALVRQANILPNPVIEAEVEEYDRDGAGFDSTETVLALSQEIELGGKRKWRTRIATLDATLTGWEYEATRLDVIAETMRRSVTVIAEQHRLALAQSSIKLAETVQQAVNERVAAGKEPPLQATKATAALEMARMDAAVAQDKLAATHNRLARMWGADQPHFESVTGNFDTISDTIPDLSSLLPRLATSPKLAAKTAVRDKRKAELAAAKAERLPNVEASFGAQLYAEDDTDALAFGIAVPLPLFDRNQGNIGAAQHLLAGADVELRATRGQLISELTDSHTALSIAYRRVQTLTKTLIPAMQEAFDVAREGYSEGKFGFLDMLDAQRELLKTTAERIDSLVTFHMAMIEVQRLTGENIEPSTKMKEAE